MGCLIEPPLLHGVRRVPGPTPEPIPKLYCMPAALRREFSSILAPFGSRLVVILVSFGPLLRGLPGSQEAPLALHGSARVSETSLQRSWYPKYKSRYPKYKSRHLKNPGTCFSRKQKPLRDDHLAATYLKDIIREIQQFYRKMKIGVTAQKLNLTGKYNIKLTF